MVVALILRPAVGCVCGDISLFREDMEPPEGRSTHQGFFFGVVFYLLNPDIRKSWNDFLRTGIRGADPEKLSMVSGN